MTEPTPNLNSAVKGWLNSAADPPAPDRTAAMRELAARLRRGEPGDALSDDGAALVN